MLTSDLDTYVKNGVPDKDTAMNFSTGRKHDGYSLNVQDMPVRTFYCGQVLGCLQYQAKKFDPHFATEIFV